MILIARSPCMRPIESTCYWMIQFLLCSLGSGSRCLLFLQCGDWISESYTEAYHYSQGYIVVICQIRSKLPSKRISYIE
ncbi:uncharacterized protein F4812DRAFT_441827 [Daldinia caldariorum]|uniref:uncharacterized protein n=1 Tax=Daldinia caldariorum TaxID=326644 RepID=UPI00200895B5|nr:uncharacterized protein F4812DRAFT_441827 [Daldinia caldariorum]KAI1464736.1 hypothetical protein F4812DRAFT_441827 [Daldinia caldariorum]